MRQLIKDVARFATPKKVVDTHLLNVLGAQVARTVGARVAYTVRPGPKPGPMAAVLAELHREGAVAVPDFLPPAQFEQLREEAERILAGGSEKLIHRVDGTNQITVARLTDFSDSMPETSKFYADPRLSTLLRAAEKRHIEPSLDFCLLESLVQGPDGEVDEQTTLHCDPFHSTFKGWLYLEDVTLDSGPFVFAKGSHRITFKQLGYVYRESCGKNAGSRRITTAELERMGLVETPFTCSKNTLVIANTFGFHRRLRGRPGCRRLSIHVNARRHNPFSLLP